MTPRSGGGQPPIRALRKALLGALVLFLGFVATLFWFGQQREGSTVESDAEAGGVDPEAGEAVFVGEGFRREVTDGGRRIFAISADRILSDREDRFELENVSIELERESGGEYRLASERGIFDLNTSNANLTGAVVVSGPDGLTLETEALLLGGKGDVVQSEAPVRFTFNEGIGGRSAKLRFNLRQDRFVLAGNVWISSRPGAGDADGGAGDEGALEGDAGEGENSEAGDEDVVLRCQRLMFERGDRRIHADEGVRVFRGQDQIFAQRLSLQLAENERDIELINARWDVVGHLRGRLIGGDSADGGGEQHEFRGQQLTVALDEETRETERIELESAGGPEVVLIREMADGVTQRITAENVYTDFAGGELTRAEAVGGVHIVETRRGKTVRSGRSRQAILSYPRGDPTGRLELAGEVHYRTSEVEASGDSADIALSADGRGEIVGQPAIVIAESGRLEAPRILQEEGRLHAVDGVRAELERGGVRIGASSSSDEPILVQSKEAYWNDDRGEYEFLGNVRAWQGENYLLAEEMTGVVASETVSAHGGVRTVWTLEPQEPNGEAPEPVEVTADSMHYDAPAQKVLYEGDVHGKQEGRNLWCALMEGFLTDGGAFDTLNCTGATRIEDPKDGTTVVGDGAIYEPGQDRVVVSGDPVVLTKGDGTEIRGERLLYDLANGTAQVQLVERPAEQDSENGSTKSTEPLEDAPTELEHADSTAGT